MSVERRKLIEVSLPLAAINRESVREKSIRHGHPSTLHLWWARRPLAAARAVLFAQLVDDPSAHPDRYPTDEAQRARRAELHELIEQLVVWENTTDEALLDRARKEIRESCDGNPPPILDPFAGGGTIPLEAQRLGLEAHASDLNPVAVLINKALIEIPPKFRDQAPVFPGLADTRASWRGAEGLAADVRAYGDWMRDEAEKRIGHHYPNAILPDGTEAPVIAWIWARTASCPNPACGIETPLVRSWWLGKKRGKEAFVVPRVVRNASESSSTRIEFAIGNDPKGPETSGTMPGRKGATCLGCGASASQDYLRSEGRAGRLGSQLMAIVAQGPRQRIYLPPAESHRRAAAVPPPAEVPDGALGYDPRAITTPNYGMNRFADLFTNRQLVALTTFSDLVGDVRRRVRTDVRTARSSGAGKEYSDAITTYLGIVASRITDRNSAVCSWDASQSKEQVRGIFARQAIPMSWDYAEANPFASSSGTLRESIEWVCRALERLPMGRGVAEQRNAADAVGAGLISTDPPYYDNIGYSDLSDFFYVWLRRNLRDIYPELLRTLLVPKSEELVANPFRHGGKRSARTFFEQGFRQVFSRARLSTVPDFPITVFYAFKQSEGSGVGDEVSTGWETLLEGMIQAGWSITATWPMRSELSNRIRSIDSNALASSIVLALRPRPDNALTTDRARFLAALRAELPGALRKLQQGGIAPVDLPQAAIGPGMAVFSRYAKVVEATGEPMTVHSALARINEILDQVLNEQEGDFDPTTRFAIAWYRQYGYNVGLFGDADNLARARNTSVAAMDRDGILTSRAGKVALVRPCDTAPTYDVGHDEHTSAWEVLHHLIRLVESEGLRRAGELLAAAENRSHGPVDADLVKELAFLLFSIAEKNGWTSDALAFNSLATSWPDVTSAAKSIPARRGPLQAALDFENQE